MNKTDLLKSVADAVTEEAFSFEISIVPRTWLDKLLQKWKLKPTKRLFEIKPLYMGSAMRITRIMLDVNIVLGEAGVDVGVITKAIAENSDKLAEAIALAITNSEKRPSKSFIRFLLYNLNHKEMVVLTKAVVSGLGFENFMTTIILLKGINVLEVKKPSEMSPQVPGSTSEEV